MGGIVMIWLIVYIVGFVIAFAFLLNDLRHVRDVTVGDIISILILSLFSWFIVLAIVILIVSIKLEDVDWKRVLRWNKVIIHKKK